MARGMANNEPVVSQANTSEYRDGYARTFGEKRVERGRWVYDEAQRRLVPADEYEPVCHAVDAPIMSGRCHEGQVAPDGTDISTRAKRQAWMRATGNVDHADYKGVREAKQKEIEAKRRGEFKKDPALRDLIGRELYKRKMIL